MRCWGQLGIWVSWCLLQLINKHQMRENRGWHEGHHGHGLVREHGRGQGAGPDNRGLWGDRGRVTLVITVIVITEAPDGQILRTVWVRVTVLRLFLDFLLDILFCVAEDEIHSEIKPIVSREFHAVLLDVILLLLG